MSAHEMTHERTASDGRELWHCNICGRVIVMNWFPAEGEALKQVLVTGDESVTHIGSKGGLKISGVEVTPGTPTPTEADLSWLNDIGIDALKWLAKPS